MTVGQGLGALFAGPLAAGMLGTALAPVIDSAQGHYDSARRYAVRTLHLDHEPAELGPYYVGEVLLYQRLDDSVHAAALLQDYQGNVYAQDPADGRLRVLPLERYGKIAPEAAPVDDDWMSHERVDDMRRVPDYFRLK